MTTTQKLLRFAGLLAAAAALSACYPIDPTPTECAREVFPPTCGCPTNQDPTGYYQPGVVYWPNNPEHLQSCRVR